MKVYVNSSSIAIRRYILPNIKKYREKDIRPKKNLMANIGQCTLIVGNAKKVVFCQSTD